MMCSVGKIANNMYMQGSLEWYIEHRGNIINCEMFFFICWALNFVGRASYDPNIMLIQVIFA